MADDNTQAPEEKAPVEETSSASESLVLPPVAVPENALVGDENLPEAREVTVDVNKDSVPAQVTGPAPVPVDEVFVHETSVKLDEVITDPSSPLAVQIPDAGRGSLELPIHALDAGTPESVFAREASDPTED